MVKEAVSYGLMVDYGKPCKTFWPDAMKTAKKGKVAHKTLCQVGHHIRKTTGWEDQVDSVSVYAHLVKAQAAQDAIVEENRKIDEDMPSPSKRVTRANDKKEEVAKPTPTITMEDAAKDKKVGKPRAPAYKLKTEIEMTTDLQKVFEERILNSRVELTLGELLGIAKPEFHGNFSGMIKRKRQIPMEAELENTSKAQHTEAFEDFKVDPLTLFCSDRVAMATGAFALSSCSFAGQTSLKPQSELSEKGCRGWENGRLVKVVNQAASPSGSLLFNSFSFRGLWWRLWWW
ncbi:hypothetical protein L7F22_067237 [Adiantum nelumboides]|nr:hypothetical protein [Adiantum nelumboides]